MEAGYCVLTCHEDLQPLGSLLMLRGLERRTGMEMYGRQGGERANPFNCCIKRPEMAHENERFVRHLGRSLVRYCEVRLNRRAYARVIRLETTVEERNTLFEGNHGLQQVSQLHCRRCKHIF